MDVACIVDIIKKSGADCGNDFSNMLYGDRVALEYNQRVNETVFH